MRADLVPAVVATVLTAGATEVPGPTKNEWAGVIMAVLALVVREALWWLRNRRGSGSSTSVDGG